VRRDVADRERGRAEGGFSQGWEKGTGGAERARGEVERICPERGMGREKAL
jgi:hypothetical protein